MVNFEQVKMVLSFPRILCLNGLITVVNVFFLKFFLGFKLIWKNIWDILIIVWQYFLIIYKFNLFSTLTIIKNDCCCFLTQFKWVLKYASAFI